MTLNCSLKAVAVWVAFLSVVFSVAAQENMGDRAIDDYNFAAWLYNTGKYKLAVESYQNFLKNYPEHEKTADVQFGLAQSLFHLDKFEEADRQYEIVRSKYGDFSQMPEVLFQLAQTRVALNKFAEAESLFAELRNRYGEHYLADWAMARQATCMISLRKFSEAEALLKTFIGKYTTTNKSAEDVPATKQMFEKLAQTGVKAGEAFLSLIERSVFYYALAQFNQDRFADAVSSFELFVVKYPKSKLLNEARFRLAQSLYRQEAYAKAAESYKPVADGTGEFADAASYEWALALYKAGKLKDASEAFAQMAKRFPQYRQAPNAQLYAGTILFETADYNGAVAHLGPLAEAKKELADEAAYWIGMSLLKAGKSAEAEKAFADAMHDFPKSSLAGDMQLGLADARMAQDKFEQAAEAFHAYSQKFQNSNQAPRALYSACAALHRADKYSESDKLCGEFLTKFKKDELIPHVLFLSGENRFLLKNYDQASVRYTELLERKDASKDRVSRVHFRLAWAHRYANRYDEALAELSKVDPSAAGETIAAEASYLKGVCLFESKEYPAAIQSLDTYLNARDHSRFGDDALLKLGVSQIKQDKKTNAVKSFERFLQEYAGSELLSQAQYQLAECYYDLKQYSKAIANYKKVADRDPPDELSPYAMFGLGLCHYDQQKWSEASQIFGQMADKFGKSELVLQALYRKGRCLVKLQKWAEAEQTFLTLLASSPKHELARTVQITIGTCLQEQKKWADAATAFKAAIDNYTAGKDQPRIFYELAWSLREAGREADALAAFAELTRNFPDNALAADAYFYLAEAKYGEKPQNPEKAEPQEQKAKRLDEARALYAQVLATSKDNRLADKAHYRIGWCCWLAEKYQEAAAEFDKLITGFPTSDLLADALFQAGQSYAKAGQPAVAIERFKQLIDNPKYAQSEYIPDAYLSLSDCQIILNQLAEAIENLTIITTKYEKHRVVPHAYFLLGKAQFDLKKNDAALTNFTEATTRTKAEVAAEAQFYIGQVYQSKEDFQSALVAYLRVIALYPEYRQWSAGATFESGKCYEKLGDSAQARNAYQNVVSNYGDTKWADPATERLQKLGKEE